jgi:hypothetical protein
MRVSGKWEGKLLDASGPMARVAAVFKQSRDQVTGEFLVYVESARGGGCGCGDWKLAQRAPVKGTARGEKLRLSYELAVGAKPVGVVFEAQLTKADPHAARALVGSYTVSDEGKQIGFEGGGCVLWLFRK